MSKYLSITFILLFVCCSEQSSKTVIDKQDYENGYITEEQGKLIFDKLLLFPNNTQISLGFIKNGKAFYYGAKRESNKIVSVDNNEKIFEIGSISKVFTSSLLASFVIDGDLKLDDDISKYVGKLHKNQKITFKELANHTSGLPRLAQNRGFGLFIDSENPYKNYGEKKLWEYLKEKMELGDKNYQYSNIGAAILGFVLGKINNKSYQDLVQERIFSKYQMKNTTTIRKDVEDKLVKGLDKNGKTTPNWDMAVHVGAGGILSTTKDLSKFAIAQLDTSNIELALTRKKTYKIKEGRSVALGWHTINNDNMDEVYTHNGGTGGYTSSIRIDLKSKNGMIVLSNVSSYNENYTAIVELCNELLQTLAE